MLLTKTVCFCKLTVHLTHRSLSGTARLCTEGLVSSFQSFFAYEDRAVASYFAMFTLFRRGMGSVCGGGLLCQPVLLPSMQFSPDICSSFTRKQHFIQISRYSVLKNKFCSNRPIPRFRPRFRVRGNHRALLMLLRSNREHSSKSIYTICQSKVK